MDIFFSAVVVGFSGAMMPGSLLTYTIKQSLSHGPRSGFIIALGHAMLEVVLLVLIFLGLDAVLQSKAAQTAIGILGGSFLIYMGVDMTVKAAKGNVSVRTDGVSAGRSMLLSGVVISAANPHFLLWWAVIGLGYVMQAYTALGYAGVAIYFTGHMLADFIWFGAVSLFIGKTGRFIKPAPYRVFIAVLGALIVFFGGGFVYGAVTGLLA